MAVDAAHAPTAGSAGSSPAANGAGPVDGSPAAAVKAWWRGRISPYRALIIIVAVLLLMEGGVRLIEHRLPRQTAGDQVEVILKYQQIQALHAAHQPVDVLFLGNSTMDAGLDPAVFATASKRFSAPYNVALLGQPMPAMTRWVRQFVLPITKPNTVVIGLTPLDIPEADLFGVSRASVQSAFDQTFDQMQPTALQRISQNLGKHVALIRNREAFHSPVEIGRAISDTITGKQLQFVGLGPTTLTDGTVVTRSESVWRNDILKPRGGNANYWGATFSGAPSWKLDSASRAIFRENTIDTGQIDQLVTTIQQHGISNIVLVVMPHQLNAIATAGVDMTTYARSVSLIKSYGKAHDLPVIDFTNNKWPNVDFFDYAHLSHQGSTRFSTELAHILDRQ